MATLITGGGSQVGSALAMLLKSSNSTAVFASRSGRVPEGFVSVKFDWKDPATFENAFTTSNITQFDSVYILPPTDDVNAGDTTNTFIDVAAQHGVKRYVLLRGSNTDINSDIGGLGVVERYLESKGFDYFVLRPTWFTGQVEFRSYHNLKTAFLTSIRERGQFESIIPTGKIPFVTVGDIAQCAFEAITAPKNVQKGKTIVGPELLTYDQLASILTKVLGRQIKHQVVTEEQLIDYYVSSGTMTREVAQWLIAMDKAVEAGSEASLLSLPAHELYTGETTVAEWLEENKGLFTANST
ncbi:ergot alkaloid A [Coprinopsis marcescibilis]|uniref:Ergot alkaloid A n=1 Tax=Coprinopsis marcescibilis TaxID=230819 RepID=A0A5C3KVR6_COPMA|nr:ergot alkaloid A [Coprinopsis marcescibilis]